MQQHLWPAGSTAVSTLLVVCLLELAVISLGVNVQCVSVCHAELLAVGQVCFTPAGRIRDPGRSGHTLT